MCHCGNKGVERTPNKSQHTKLSLEKKILPPLLPGFELATIRSRVRRSSRLYGKDYRRQPKKSWVFFWFFLDMRCHFQRHKQSDIFIKKNYTTVIISKDINNRKYLKRIITTRLKTKIDYAAMNKQSSKP